ncbi:hypothetical protein ACGFY3_49060 [Streptomyces mirabilis]|uniref:hypothetical protein n=1 Tax=Streptomyces mirabilis TaxID=68239 RepID=UPI00371503EC
MKADESSRGWQRGWGNIVYCPELTIHPDEPLPVVVERVLRSSVPPDEAPALAYRACGNRDHTSAWHDGVYRIHQLCRECGVSLAVQRADAPDPLLTADHARQWKEIWRRRNESPRNPS